MYKYPEISLLRGEQLIPGSSSAQIKNSSLQFPGRITPGFSHVGIVPDDDAGRWNFARASPVSPTLKFWHCSILTSITLIGSQDLAGHFQTLCRAGCVAPTPANVCGDRSPKSDDVTRRKINIFKLPLPPTPRAAPVPTGHDSKPELPRNKLARNQLRHGGKDSDGPVGDVGAGAKEAGNSGNDVLGTTPEEVDGTAPFVDDRVTSEDVDGTIPIWNDGAALAGLDDVGIAAESMALVKQETSHSKKKSMARNHRMLALFRAPGGHGAACIAGRTKYNSLLPIHEYCTLHQPIPTAVVTAGTEMMRFTYARAPYQFFDFKGIQGHKYGVKVKVTHIQYDGWRRTASSPSAPSLGWCAFRRVTLFLRWSCQGNGRNLRWSLASPRGRLLTEFFTPNVISRDENAEPRLLSRKRYSPPPTFFISFSHPPSLFLSFPPPTHLSPHLSPSLFLLLSLTLLSPAHTNNDYLVNTQYGLCPTEMRELEHTTEGYSLHTLNFIQSKVAAEINIASDQLKGIGRLANSHYDCGTHPTQRRQTTLFRARPLTARRLEHSSVVSKPCGNTSAPLGQGHEAESSCTSRQPRRWSDAGSIGNRQVISFQRIMYGPKTLDNGVAKLKRRNERVGITGDPQENPQTSYIARHDSRMRKSKAWPGWRFNLVHLGRRRAG
ncbi:hypothetical protein PR048_021294 [Dryococelus australis]|uniref:Uncharacterized protein n=1 Tax=Dryococelus australis TaxID=614101 RepID=A0ABQ9GXW7_9NEOP|nr:hypothetical protein PR048_021294 [Dryococelus australis]